MAKNFAAIYGSGNPSSALNQSFFLKEESVKGTASIPTGTDFLYTLSGGSINFTQPKESSPHRSGRHNNNIIKQKTSTEWSLSTYFNIDVDAAHGSQVDQAVRTLLKNTLGQETDTGTQYDYDAKVDPSKTFTLFENLDHMAKQAVGCVVESAELQFPGDGQAQTNYSGFGKFVYHAGIAKLTADANAGNDVTVAAAESYRFDVGSYVMLVEADGITRSADTPDGTPRRITAVNTTTGVITLDGAVLADADGSAADVYLCYYEPETPAGIDEPQTGLQGSLTIDTLAGLDCMRSATISLTNNHELINYCFGKEGLGDKVFVAGGRLDVSVSIELNLDADLAGWMQRLREFEAHAITLILGDSTARHLNVTMPRVIFDVPSITVPETGSVPVSFEGMALQSTLDAGDEVTVSVK